MILTGMLPHIAEGFNIQDILNHYTYFDPASGRFQSLALLTEQAGSLWLTIGTLLTLIFSLICCFYGYRLLRIITSISGFVIGSYLGSTLLCPLLGLSGPFTILIPMICGGVLASFAWMIYNVGLCLLAFFLAYSAAQILIPFGDVPKVIVCVFLGIVAAVITHFLFRPGLILFTAIFGGIRSAAALLAASAYFKIQLPALFAGVVPLSLAMIAAGTIVQFFVTGKKK